MDPKFRPLPHLKRFTLLQKQHEHEHHYARLPAKKRKDSREPPEKDTATVVTAYCLPAKKRVRAFQPDLIPGELISQMETATPVTDYCLPAKKRVRAFQPDLISGELISEMKKTAMAVTDYCLPAKKRVRAFQPDLIPGELISEMKKTAMAVTDYCLPAKKRVRAFQPDLISGELISEMKKTAMAVTDYCLPAKKRVRAFPPDLISGERISAFDLDKPSVEEEKVNPISIWIPPVNDTRDEAETQHTGDGEEEENDDDDGVLCAICQSTDGDPSDPIVFCDGCDLMVHSSCYGNPLINGVPDGDWFCAHCSDHTTDPVSCCLCPVAGGAVKTTADGRWAHILCALFVPEVFFKDPQGREGIDCSMVPKRRWNDKCYLCKNQNGCAIDCSEPKCALSFHVTCGLKEELCIEYREGKKKGAVVAAFCKAHSELWKKQQRSGKFKIVARED